MKQIYLITIVLLSLNSYPQGVWKLQRNNTDVTSFKSIFMLDKKTGWAGGNGSFINTSAIYHYNGYKWEGDGDVRNWTNSLHFADKNNGFAVGNFGAISKYKNNKWQAELN